MQPPAPAPLENRPLPAWFDDAKVGIFIHWGVYAVPAWAPTDETSSISLNCSEWYLRKLKMPFKDRSRTREYHAKTYGSSTSYFDLAKLWTASAWKPNEWAQEFAQAGARYVVLTSKHHDGFCLWPTDYVTFSDSSVAETGPLRDIVGELAAAVRSAGLRFGLYYSLLEWYNPLYLSKTNKEGSYVHDIVHPQMKELVQKYRPEVLWCDGDWSHSSAQWEAKTFLRWLYEESAVRDTVVANDRWGKDAKPARFGTYSCAVDRQRPETLLPHKWECCYTIGKSWGYNAIQTDSDYKPTAKVLADLVHTVAYGGNFLLNVGPREDGTLAPQELRCLREVGVWLRKNGEAIYETATLPTPSVSCSHGTAYFTRPKAAKRCIYALVVLQRAAEKGALIAVKTNGWGLGARGKATLVGGAACELREGASVGELRVQMPEAARPDEGPVVLRFDNVTSV